jgi:hypothetical protein
LWNILIMGLIVLSLTAYANLRTMGVLEGRAIYATSISGGESQL